MKKLLSLFLVLVLCLSLCACGSNKTELTLDNYDNYISIDAWVSSGNSYNRPINAIGGVVYDSMPRSLSVGAEVNGLSANHNYNDVVVTIRAYGTFKKCTILNNGYVNTDNYVTESFETTLQINTNISGSSNDSVFEDIFQSQNEVIDGYTLDYEVVEITGTVSPA